MRWLSRAALGTALLAVPLCVPSLAQTFPNRPITLVVASAAGGTTDILARFVAKSMTDDLKQSVVVENVVGGGATVGTRRVVRADPDGYQLIFGNMGSLAANVWLFPNLGFDPRKDLAPVGLVATVPMVLSVSKQSGVQDLRGFIAKMKAKERGVNFAHAGPATTTQIASATLQYVVGAKATDVAYRGSGPALNDLMSGVVDALIDQTVTMIPAHTGGTIRAIAVSSDARLPQIPDVPTFKEGGAPEFDLTVWNAIAAPAATPKPVLDRLVASLKVALADPDLRRRFEELAAEVPKADQQGPEPLRQLIVRDIDRLGTVIKAAGLKVE